MKDPDRLREGQTFALTEGLVDESDLPRVAQEASHSISGWRPTEDLRKS